MEESFKKHIEINFPFLKEANLLVACSGGVDSVVLGFLLRALGYQIGLAHCNFQLRGQESDEDESFVSSLSEKWEVPFYSEVFETSAYAKQAKVSIQMAARELRYTWFEEISTDFHYDYILTAHHADDVVETLFINLSRGSGIKGLMGIPAQKGKVVRPMLPFSKDAIVQYAKERGLHWREDASNAKTDYLRNSVRHELLPAVKKVFPNWLEAVATSQQYLRDTEALVSDYVTLVAKLVSKEKDGLVEIDIKQLQGMPNHKALLYELLSPYGFTAWEDIYELLAAQSGKHILSTSHRLLKNRETLILSSLPEIEKISEKKIKKNERQIDDPLRMSFLPTDKIGNLASSVIYVDADKLDYPLLLRKWQKGDVFQPFGMKGKKKLSKFFKDEKLSLATKEKLWVLWSGDKIVWIVGLRPDERFKVTPQTTQILKISVAE